MKRKNLLIAILVTTLFLSAGGFTLNYVAVNSKAGVLAMFLNYMGVVADPALQAQIADLSRQMETLQKMVVLLIPQQTNILLQQQEEKKQFEEEPDKNSDKQQEVQKNSSKDGTAPKELVQESVHEEKTQSARVPEQAKPSTQPKSSQKTQDELTKNAKSKPELEPERKSGLLADKGEKSNKKPYVVPQGTCNSESCGSSLDFTSDIVALKEKCDTILRTVESEKNNVLTEVTKLRDDSFLDTEKVRLQVAKAQKSLAELQEQDQITATEQAAIIRKQDEILKKITDVMTENTQLKSKVERLEAGYNEKLNAALTDIKQLNEKVEVLIKKVEEIQAEEDNLDEDKINDMIDQSLKLYSADKVGMPDYALESAGAVVFTIGDTQPYTVDTPWMGIFGIPIWRSSKTPRLAIQVDTSPGNCWSFTGSKGSLTIQLAAQVFPEYFTIDHIPKSLAPHGDASSAPNHFRVLGLDYGNAPKGHVLGNYEFIEFPLQTFQVQQNPYEKYFRFIKVEVLSNHGNKDYTCLYRFRVHGKPLDISTFNG